MSLESPADQPDVDRADDVGLKFGVILEDRFSKVAINSNTPDIAKAKAEPADYTKSMTDFASAAAEMAAENLAAFAEVAKKVQMETVELMLAAGKEASEDATAAVKKASADVQDVAKKAAAAAK